MELTYFMPMNELFDLPVMYKGAMVSFKAQLLVLGYTHKIRVEVQDITLLFEPDEEQNYRGVIEDENKGGGYKLDFELLKAIAGAIEDIRK